LYLLSNSGSAPAPAPAPVEDDWAPGEFVVFICLHLCLHILHSISTAAKKGKSSKKEEQIEPSGPVTLNNKAKKLKKRLITFYEKHNKQKVSQPPLSPFFRAFGGYLKSSTLIYFIAGEGFQGGQE
jgi:hypothetical protein